MKNYKLGIVIKNIYLWEVSDNVASSGISHDTRWQKQIWVD